MKKLAFAPLIALALGACSMADLSRLSSSAGNASSAAIHGTLLLNNNEPSKIYTIGIAVPDQGTSTGFSGSDFINPDLSNGMTASADLSSRRASRARTGPSA